MEEKKEELFGVLFGSINVMSEEHLDLMLQTMDKDTSIYYLIEAVKAAYSRGAFSIGETEVISRSIRTISKQ